MLAITMIKLVRRVPFVLQPLQTAATTKHITYCSYILHYRSRITHTKLKCHLIKSNLYISIDRYVYILKCEGRKKRKVEDEKNIKTDNKQSII